MRRVKEKSITKRIISFIGVLILLVACFILATFGKPKNVGNDENLEEELEEPKGIFAEYLSEAEEELKTMTLEEKIGQLFLARYHSENAAQDIQNYKLGGYIFFEKDFKNKTEEEVKKEILSLQQNSKIPLLIAVDEEGGEVVRVSSNKNLVKERFKSPSELYNLGGFEKIREDTISKSNFLYNLGINVNLAPVVDVPISLNDYIYKRSFGTDTNLTTEYAKTVITASKEGKVSYTLKHFPGYGNNTDTHTGIAIDNRSYEEIEAHDLRTI